MYSANSTVIVATVHVFAIFHMKLWKFSLLFWVKSHTIPTRLAIGE